MKNSDGIHYQGPYNYKVWFKINLTLFKSHIFHKWENKIDCFFSKCENGIKIDVEIMKWVPFSDKWSKIILHTRRV